MTETEKPLTDGTKKPETAGTKKTPSPYDLNSNDNLGNVITQVQLQGENYEEWARAMKISLRARRKWGFVDGTHERPNDGAPEMEDWWTVQSMLVSWILNAIEPTLRSTVTYAENAKELWEDIRDRFSVVNGPRIQQLKAELANCKQQGMTMVSFYGKLKTLWDELANYEQIPRCLCGGCKCDIASKLEKRREEERVHQFLMGLDDVNYGTVRSNLLATDPLPSINRVYFTLVQEERMKTITRAKEERGEIMGLAVQTGQRMKGRGEAKDKSVLIVYPDWWGERPRNELRTGGRGKAQQRSGSTIGRGRGGAVRANAAQVAGGNASNSVAETEKSGLAGLSNEQWQTLVDMLNNQKANINEKMTDVLLECKGDNHKGGRNVTPINDCVDEDCDDEGIYYSDQTHDVRGGTSHDETQNMEEAEHTSNTSGMGEEAESITSTDQLGQGHRIKHPSVRLRDYVTNTIRKLSPSVHPPATSHDSVPIIVVELVEDAIERVMVRQWSLWVDPDKVYPARSREAHRRVPNEVVPLLRLENVSYVTPPLIHH
ncbi:Retrotransposon gag domain [Sesbania bispinosa]|nr:Retrotransposon gag domain [Sesbania bispinosa]